MEWTGEGDTGTMADSSSSSSFVTEQKKLLKIEKEERNIRKRNISITAIGRKNRASYSEENDETKSQQFVSLRTEPVGFLRRTLSFQLGKTKDSFKLDPETSAMIKFRYKDISKYVIWPDCALPEEYNRSFVTFNSDHSKTTAVRYNHAGNHQAAFLRIKDGETTEKDLAIVPFGSPKTFPRTKHQKQQPYYTIYPAHNFLPSTSLATVEEEQQHKRAVSLDPETITGETVVDIEDDRTPIPKRVINSVRRSESSDEDEPIVSMTARQLQDESGSNKGDVAGGDCAEPDLQIWRL